MSRYSFQANEGAAGERLDVFLATSLGRSRNQARHLLDDGLVSIAGRVQKANYLVQPHDMIEVAEAQPATVRAPQPPELPIVYEDDAVLVVNKPAGLVTHGADSITGEASVADFARSRTEDDEEDRPGIVHRLDRDTSGLLLIAKTVKSKADLQAQFRAHRVEKTYTLLAVGRVNPAEAVIRLPLGRDETRPLRQAVTPHGKEAITKYRTLAAFPGYTLVEASPKTGRTHQLRIHFAAIGHPVAGDTTYGPPQRPLGLRRQFLHASAITFVTPATGQSVSLQCPLPKDLNDVLHIQLGSD